MDGHRATASKDTQGLVLMRLSTIEAASGTVCVHVAGVLPFMPVPNFHTALALRASDCSPILPGRSDSVSRSLHAVTKETPEPKSDKTASMPESSLTLCPPNIARPLYFLFAASSSRRLTTHKSNPAPKCATTPVWACFS